MIGETGERKSAEATPDGQSRKKKKKKRLVVNVSGSHLVLALSLHSGILTQQLWLKPLATLNVVAFLHSVP